jgi:ubiquinone/menaquinone biosynthesis C-methylase UbiE
MNYDSIADNYASTVDQKLFHTHYERPSMLKHIPQDLQSQNILDLGCGTGWYSEQCILRKANVLSVDMSEKMIEITKKRLLNKGQLIQHDLSMPFTFLNDSSINFIIAPLVIHYIEHWEPLFKECYRILKEGGTFVFSTHNPYFEIERFKLQDYFKAKLLKDTWESIGNVEYYHHSLSELFKSIKEARFNIDTIEEPKPLEELKFIDQNLYEHLRKVPALIIGVLKK